jgi:hypothetical protein
MKNVYLIPTDKPSRLHKSFDKAFILSIEPTTQNELYKSIPQNIYITSDLEIKEGGYVFWEGKIYTYGEFMKMRTPVYTDYFSIILTTDQDLIKDGVQAIDDEFLEWFVKNPSCEWIEVKDSKIVKEHIFDGSNDGEIIWQREIIIPQEEPKQYPIGGYTPGFYSCTCVTCKEKFQGHKRAYQCEPCAIKMTQEEPKQSTVGKKFYESADKTITVYSQKIIKKAAKSYRSSTANKMAIEEVAFQEGAKSNAAKEYWYKKFWEDYKNKTRISLTRKI